MAWASRKPDDRQVHEARDSHWTLLYSENLLLLLTANQGCENISGSMLALYQISKNRHGSPPVRSNSVLRNMRIARVGSESSHDTVSPVRKVEKRELGTDERHQKCSRQDCGVVVDRHYGRCPYAC